MADTLAVAKYLNDLWRNEHIDENGMPFDMSPSRLNHMMYFVQRESIIKSKRDATLFGGDIMGWSYGPVVTMLRNELKKGNGIQSDATLSEADQALIRGTYERYRDYPTRTLDRLCHEAFSWQYSRIGLTADEIGDAPIKRNALLIDAIHEEIRRELEEQDA
ncbi:MAG: DUF4065 domain-containing protein [Clostridiales bacterium]|nr:DUF4065 domain-containing protein [Candidatus Blautia equi]